MSDALAYVGIPLQSAYCGAKFACRGFTEAVRAELLAEGSNVSIGMVHLPAVNTTQFDWCATRLPMHPQPVPPSYQPDVVARVIVAAALDRRRSKIIGSWNKLIVGGTKLAPDVIAHFAARTGVSSQQADRPVASDRPSDLWQRADGTSDFGARGGFGDRSRGALDPSFLRALPSTLITFAQSVAEAATDKSGIVGSVSELGFGRAQGSEDHR